MIERGQAAQFDASINEAIEIGVSEQVSVHTIGVERKVVVSEILLCICQSSAALCGALGAAIDRLGEAVRAGVQRSDSSRPPNFYFDQDKKLRQIQSDAPITDLDANFLEGWMWGKHASLAGALENAIFEALDDTTPA